MKYNNIEFEAIIATPCCGKSYVCDKYPNVFVDLDEERLKLRYYVPENITRAELEQSKGNRPFKKRMHGSEYLTKLYELMDKWRKQGKILIASPHPEFYNYFLDRNIKFCLVYAGSDMRSEVLARYIKRGNQASTYETYDKMFDEFIAGNEADTRPSVKYAFSEGEYLEQILKKFGCKF